MKWDNFLTDTLKGLIGTMGILFLIGVILFALAKISAISISGKEWFGQAMPPVMIILGIIGGLAFAIGRAYIQDASNNNIQDKETDTLCDVPRRLDRRSKNKEKDRIP